MTYQQILDRDVPEIVRESKELAGAGLVGDTAIYYRHEAITGLCESSTKTLGAEWKPTGVSIPCNIPWDAWNNYLRNRLGNCPLFV